MSDKRYIVDANVLIIAARDYVDINVFPEFWTSLKNQFLSKKIILVDKVWDEIVCGDDALAAWCRALPGECIYKTGVLTIFNGYSRVLEYVGKSGYYKDAALELWAKESVADPWIIAVAMSTENSVIVTDERGNSALNKQYPSKEAKIPDVAKNFGVLICSLAEAFRGLSVDAK